MTRTNLYADRRSRRTSFALCMLALAACGDEAPQARPDKQPDRVLDTSRSGSAAEVNDDDEDGADAEKAPVVLATREINQAFWFTGWKVTLGTATLKVEDGNRFGTLTLAATFENLLSGSARRFGEGTQDLVLAANAKFYEVAASGNVAPLVPSGEAGEGTFRFSVPDTFDIDLATLRIGSSDFVQAVVPLGATGDALVSLEPEEFTVGKAMVAGDLTVTVKKTVVRANAENFQQAVGTRCLLLEISVENTSSARSYSLVSREFGLSQPDGRQAMRNIGGLNATIARGVKLDGERISFTVPEVFAGDYSLNIGGNALIPATNLTFTLP